MVINKNNTLINSILFYLIVVFIIIYHKPDFIYDNFERLKKFGINNDEKSLTPLPIFIVLISIGIYLLFTLINILLN